MVVWINITTEQGELIERIKADPNEARKNILPVDTILEAVLRADKIQKGE